MFCADKDNIEDFVSKEPLRQTKTLFIFQVFCADKDNIEDVRSGSEAEVDSESDNPRKER